MTRMLLGALVSALVISGCTGTTTSPIQAEWVRRFDGYPGHAADRAVAVCVGADGHVYVAGDGAGTPRNQFDYVTIKYDSLGRTKWAKSWDGTNSKTNSAYAVDTDRDGNVYVTGCNVGVDEDFIATLRYDSTGEVIWERRCYAHDAFADFLRTDGAGNPCVVGSIEESLRWDGKWRFTTLIIKYSTAGDTLWMYKYNGPTDDGAYPQAVAADESGNVYIACQTDDTLSGSQYATLKYSSGGDILWERSHHVEGEYSYPTALGIDRHGNVYVAGIVEVILPSQSPVSVFRERVRAEIDFVVLKYRPSGTIAWEKSFKRSHIDNYAPHALTVDQSGRVYLTGGSTRRVALEDFESFTYSDVLTMALDSNGTLLWERRYDGAAHRDDRAGHIAVDREGNVFVAGTTQRQHRSLDTDFLLLTYSQDGRLRSAETYTGDRGGYDIARAMAIDSVGNVYITGDGGGNFFTIKYTPASRSAER